VPQEGLRRKIFLAVVLSCENSKADIKVCRKKREKGPRGKGGGPETPARESWESCGQKGKNSSRLEGSMKKKKARGVKTDETEGGKWKRKSTSNKELEGGESAKKPLERERR